MKNHKVMLFHFLILLLIASWIVPSIDYFTIQSSSSDFQSINSWLPLIKSVKFGDIIFSGLNMDITNLNIHFYPYLTLWFYGLIAWLLGMKGIVILSTIIFPVFSFHLLYRIFFRHLSELWSIAISLTCLLAFSDWPFRSFLIGIIKGTSINELATIQPLEIAHYPIPSFSVMVFLIIFYFSTKKRKLTLFRISLFTCLWSLSSQIHAIDALYGIAFWFIYFPIQFFIQSGRDINKDYIKMIIYQLIIGLVCLSPILLLWKTSSTYHSLEEIGLINSGPSGNINLFYFGVYFVLPFILTLIVYFVKKIDSYEIFTSFIHVYILLFVEFLILASSLLLPNSIHIDIVQNRIPLFFLHFYYYIPFIYLVTRPVGYEYSYGLEATKFSKKIDFGLNYVFNRLDKIYLYLIIFLLFIFSGNSSYKSYNHHKYVEGPALKETINEYNEIINILPAGSLVISETPATNLIPQIDFNKNYKTLWTNRFTNNISSGKIMDGLLLYAYIYNWPKEKFLQFMSPGNLQKGRAEIVDLSKNKIHKAGIGYWLLNHKKNISGIDFNNYLFSLSDCYDNINIKELLSDFDVTHIYSINPISDEIIIKSATKLGNGFLYQIDI